MGLGVRCPDVVGTKMRVDLGRAEVGMTEHCLNRAQVRASTKQMRGERVAKLVRRWQREEPDARRIASNHFPKALSSEAAPRALPARRNEQNRLVRAPYPPDLQIA